MSFAVDSAFWRGRRVLLTGHTGFKGSWLALWLHDLGARVTGYALAAETDPDLFGAARLHELCDHHIGDIRDLSRLSDVVARARPEIVLHLAAQPLVRRSYRQPCETFAINVQGTVNLLECCRRQDGVAAIVIVSSDKCYHNREWRRGYREDDRLGGHDPYSASKACAELATQSYRAAFPGMAPIGSARAGNVFGGGDWSEDRLVPDALRAFAAGETLVIRAPDSERPWQHVAEPLAGYLMLARALAEGGRDYARGWNFGPGVAQIVPVRDVVEQLASMWGDGAAWMARPDPNAVHEAGLLHLDAGSATRRLGWRPAGDLAGALAATIAWQRDFMDDIGPAAIRRNMRADRDRFAAANITPVFA